jgi:hypothetical protein
MVPERSGPSDGPSLAARVASLLLGCWLFASTFLWPHASSAGFNTWLSGFLIASAATVAIYVPRTRFVNTAIALWLVVAATTFDHLAGLTLWNNLAVAVAVFLLSLVGPRRRVPAAERAPA